MENDTLNIYDYWYKNHSIFEFKMWIDDNIAKGKTTIGLELEWGYYQDVDGIILKAE